MKNDIEKIICSAVWYDNFPLEKEEIFKYKGFRPYNIDRGIVFSGWRHGNCIYQAVAISGKPSRELGEVKQGFLTSKNRFVDRQEAIFIAMLSGQITREKANSITQLYSEDLW